jgi:hypothetical protein
MGSKSYSKGISWIDDCRIPFVDEGDIKSATPGSLNATGEFSSFGFKSGNELNTTGRFPANLLVSDDMLNDGVISKSVSGGKGKPIPRQDRMAEETITERGGFNDKGTNSRYYDIDKWFDNLIDV